MSKRSAAQLVGQPGQSHSTDLSIETSIHQIDGSWPVEVASVSPPPLEPIRANILYLPGRWQRATPFSLDPTDGDVRVWLASAGYRVFAAALAPSIPDGPDCLDFGLSDAESSFKKVIAQLPQAIDFVVGFSAGAALASLLQGSTFGTSIGLILLDGAPTVNQSPMSVESENGWNINPCFSPVFMRAATEALSRPSFDLNGHAFLPNDRGVLSSLVHAVDRWPVKLIRDIAQADGEAAMRQITIPILAISSKRQATGDARIARALSATRTSITALRCLPEASHNDIAAGRISYTQVAAHVCAFLEALEHGKG